MTEPKQPDDHPVNAATPTDPHGKSPNGVPKEMDGSQAKGTPDSDRNETEHAAKQ